MMKTEPKHRENPLPTPASNSRDDELYVVAHMLKELHEDMPESPVFQVMKPVFSTYNRETGHAVIVFGEQTKAELAAGTPWIKCDSNAREDEDHSLIVTVARRSGDNKYRVMVGTKDTKIVERGHEDVCSCVVGALVSYLAVQVIERRLADTMAQRFAERLGIDPETVGVIAVNGPEEAAEAMAALKEAQPTATVVNLAQYKSKAEAEAAIDKIQVVRTAPADALKDKAAHVVSGTDTPN